MLSRLKPSAAAAEKPSEKYPYETLTEREIEVLRKAAQGKVNKDIALDLSISVRTVQAHLRNIFNKIGVGSRSEAVVYGLKKGWFTLDDLP